MEALPLRAALYSVYRSKELEIFVRATVGEHRPSEVGHKVTGL